jgi:replicative DNA helicase
LSQLNRGVESREGIDGKRPQLSDLRESGAIEQDADMVCFIHRPEYYKLYQDDKGRDLRGKAEIIIAKHRNGAVGDVLLEFKGEFARFSDPDEHRFVPVPGEQGGIIESKGLSPEEQASMLAQNPFDTQYPPMPSGDAPF